MTLVSPVQRLRKRGFASRGQPFCRSPRLSLRPTAMSESNVKFSEAEALEFHSRGRPGKLEIIASKPMATQRDLSLAYSPGVAIPVQAIADDPARAYELTAKGNLVAVISN